MTLSENMLLGELQINTPTPGSWAPALLHPPALSTYELLDHSRYTASARPLRLNKRSEGHVPTETHLRTERVRRSLACLASREQRTIEPLILARVQGAGEYLISWCPSRMCFNITRLQEQLYGEVFNRPKRQPGGIRG